LSPVLPQKSASESPSHHKPALSFRRGAVLCCVSEPHLTRVTLLVCG
jgi:hypothetical protein